MAGPYAPSNSATPTSLLCQASLSRRRASACVKPCTEDRSHFGWARPISRKDRLWDLARACAARQGASARSSRREQAVAQEMEVPMLKASNRNIAPLSALAATCNHWHLLRQKASVPVGAYARHARSISVKATGNHTGTTQREVCDLTNALSKLWASFLGAGSGCRRNKGAEESGGRRLAEVTSDPKSTASHSAI